MLPGMRTQTELSSLAEAFLGAWNSQDVDAVAAVYTDDVIYTDPNLETPLEGAEALRRYLTTLFGLWEMHWSLREPPFPLAGEDGAAVTWRATFRKPGGQEAVEAEGMDLVLLDGDRIKRNEVYFDRAALAPLLATH